MAAEPERLLKSTGTSFEDWCKALDTYHEMLRQTVDGFIGYGPGSVVAGTGDECWMGYYDSDLSPEDALDEDRTYWDD